MVAVVVHSDMRRTGWFSCSHALLDRLHENVVWGMRGNFLHLPTDCPQRDERLGWTGDIQVFSPTATYLYDCAGFLASWLRDLAIEQRMPAASCPFVVPNVLRDSAAPAAAWGDAATVVPAVAVRAVRRPAVLAAQYDSMRAWVDVLLELAGDTVLWEGRFQFGDWLDPAAPPDGPADASTDPDIVASAYLFRSADLLARAAALLGRDDDAERYARRGRARARGVPRRVRDAGRPDDVATPRPRTRWRWCSASSPTARRAQVMGDRLAELVRAAGYRIGTGFVGTPIVQDALTATGHLDVATRLLLADRVPVLALPGDDGRDHDLGALGQHARRTARSTRAR